MARAAETGATAAPGAPGAERPGAPAQGRGHGPHPGTDRPAPAATVAPAPTAAAQQQAARIAEAGTKADTKDRRVLDSGLLDNAGICVAAARTIRQGHTAGPSAPPQGCTVAHRSKHAFEGLV